MSFKVVFTPHFLKELKPLVKKYPSLKKEIQTLHDQLREQPTSGIYLGGGCYKIRLAISSKNTGKSGGARVITYVTIKDKIVFILSIYDKSEQGDISVNELQNLLGKLPD